MSTERTSPANVDGASTTLVIPVFNASAFIRRTLEQAWEWLASRPEPAELLVVDDGSEDGSAAIVEEFERGRPRDGRTRFRTLLNDRNRGKGYSVRRGFLEASGSRVVFTDADLTYPIHNVAAVLAALDAGADVAVANRMHADSVYVVSPSFFSYLYTRHAMGRVFNRLVRWIVGPKLQDTQAGLKGFRRDAARRLARRATLDRFSFDVELLFIADRLGLRVVGCPVEFLYRKEPSTVHFARDAARMFADMLRIRWRALRGRYDLEEEEPPTAVSLGPPPARPASTARREVL